MVPARSLSHIRRLLVLSLILTAAWSIRSSAATRGFRGVEWGASKAEVRQSEKLPIHHELEGEIAFWNFKLAGVDAGLIYEFEDNQLVRAYYLSRHRTPDPTEDYADYRTFQRHFDEHFGSHLEESWIWADGATHGEDEQTLEAVTSGRAKLVSRWKIEGARLRLEMAGEDGAIQTLHAYFEPTGP